MRVETGRDNGEFRVTLYVELLEVKCKFDIAGFLPGCDHGGAPLEWYSDQYRCYNASLDLVVQAFLDCFLKGGKALGWGYDERLFLHQVEYGCAVFVSMDGNGPSMLNVVLENCSNRYCLSFRTFSSLGSNGNFSGR